MKYSLSALLVLLPTTMGIILGYDDNYGVATNSLTTVACSDGQNGLITRGFHTFGDLPTFPNIASSPAVVSWNSPACGSCWNLTYTNPQGVARSLVVTAIDHADSGFYTSVTSLDAVTGGNAVAWGQVDVSAVQIARSACGL